MIKYPLKLGNRINENDFRSYKNFWNKSAPFIMSVRGVLVHRPKSIFTFFRDYKTPGSVRDSSIDRNFQREHSVAEFYCGGRLFVEKGCRFFDSVPTNRIVCERCELFALNSGLPSSDTICGRHVCIGGVRAYSTYCDKSSN